MLATLRIGISILILLWTGNLAHGGEEHALLHQEAQSALIEGDVARGIISLERLVRKHPRDEKLLQDLKVARSMVSLEYSNKRPAFRGLFTRDSIGAAKSARELSLMAALTILTSLLLWLFLSAGRKRKFGPILLCGFLVLVAISMLALAQWKMKVYSDPSTGIVLKDSQLFFEPYSSTAVNEKVLAGAKLWELRNQGDWSNVKLKNGQEGWIKTKDFEFIKAPVK